jgi:hypothetical protein
MCSEDREQQPTAPPIANKWPHSECGDKAERISRDGPKKKDSQQFAESPDPDRLPKVGLELSAAVVTLNDHDGTHGRGDSALLPLAPGYTKSRPSQGLR